MTTISRRLLIQGSAWATPVVLAGVTVPAYAASLPEDKCPNFSVKPTITPGEFKLTLPTDIERMTVTTVDGNIDPKIFASPQWVHSADEKTAFWVPGLADPSQPSVTMTLSIVPDATGKITAIFDLPGCDSYLYNGTTVTVRA